MKIENNISNTPNIITFEGNDYDLQLTMYVVSQFEDFNDILNSMGKVETVFKMLAAMMNADIIKNKRNLPKLDADYISACTSMVDMPKYTEAIAKAMGLELKTEADEELERAFKDDNVPDVKN